MSNEYETCEYCQQLIRLAYGHARNSEGQFFHKRTRYDCYDRHLAETHEDETELVAVRSDN